MNQAQNQPQGASSTETIKADLEGNLTEAFRILQNIWSKACAIRLMDDPPKPMVEAKSKDQGDFVGYVYNQIDRLRDINTSLRALEDHMNKII